MTENAMIPPQSLGEQLETRERLVSVANALIPMLRSTSESSEKERRLSDEAANALRAAGLFQACAPSRVGGSEGNARTLIELVAELSRGDSSAGWVAMIANMTAWSTGMLPDDARQAVFGNDSHSVAISQFGAGGTAVETPDGYLVNGKWAFASGSHHAQWTISGIMVVDETGQPQEIRWALMPTSQMDLEDTWHVAGMAGTGSNTLVARDLLVPTQWTIPLDVFNGRTFPRWHTDEPTYQSSIAGIAILALASPLWGMAEAIWDITQENMATARPLPAWRLDDVRNSAGWRAALGEARASIDTGKLHLLRAADDLDLAALEGRVLDLNERARLRSDQAVATSSFRAGVELLMDLNGTRAFALSNPLQRIWRDFGTASRHALNNGPLNREVYAYSLTGLDMDAWAEVV